MFGNFNYLHQFFSKLLARTSYAHYDQFVQQYRMPANPKIVVFGDSPNAQALIDTHFHNFNSINGAQFKDSADKRHFAIAEQVLRINQDSNGGHIIRGYPTTVAEAINFDTIIDGVNLAINIQSSGDKQHPLTKYYEERGLLLNFTIDEKIDINAQSKKLDDAILSSIKH